MNFIIARGLNRVWSWPRVDGEMNSNWEWMECLKFACPKLRHEGHRETNMWRVSFQLSSQTQQYTCARLSRQGETGQCCDSMSNIWWRKTKVWWWRLSYGFHEWVLVSLGLVVREYMHSKPAGSCWCQTCNNNVRHIWLGKHPFRYSQ